MTSSDQEHGATTVLLGGEGFAASDVAADDRSLADDPERLRRAVQAGLLDDAVDADTSGRRLAAQPGRVSGRRPVDGEG